LPGDVVHFAKPKGASAKQRQLIASSHGCDGFAGHGLILDTAIVYCVFSVHGGLYCLRRKEQTSLKSLLVRLTPTYDRLVWAAPKNAADSLFFDFEG